MLHRNYKVCFWLQLQITRIGIQYPSNMEPPSLVLPLVYDITTNLTQLAEKRDTGPAPAMTAASQMLKHFVQFQTNPNECSLFPAVRELLMNLTLPSEPQQVNISCRHFEGCRLKFDFVSAWPGFGRCPTDPVAGDANGTGWPTRVSGQHAHGNDGTAIVLRDGLVSFMWLCRSVNVSREGNKRLIFFSKEST